MHLTKKNQRFWDSPGSPSLVQIHTLLLTMAVPLLSVPLPSVPLPCLSQTRNLCQRHRFIQIVQELFLEEQGRPLCCY